jgi:hypothetical protein
MRKPGTGIPQGAKTVSRPDNKSRPATGADVKPAKRAAAPEKVPADSKQLFGAEASKLLDMFRSGHHDVVQIADFFAKYPALGTEAIKRSNSAVFHRSVRTTDIENAILRLGDFELYDIVFNALAKHQRG